MRNSSFDLIRGLMIIYVVSYHVYNSYTEFDYHDIQTIETVYSWMAFFMMPFYFISGYFMRKKMLLEFVCYAWKKIVFPYLIFLLSAVILFEINSYVLSHEFSKAFACWYMPTGSFLVNQPLWFMLSLFFVQLLNTIVYSISKWFNICYRKVNVFVFMVALLGALATCNKPQILNIGNICSGYVIFVCGAVFRKVEESGINLDFLICPLLIAYFAIGFIWPQNSLFAMNYVGNGNWFISVLQGVSATIALYIIFKKGLFLRFPFSLMCYIGKVSVVIFGLHSPLAKYIIKPILDMAVIPLGVSVFVEIIIVLALCVAFSPMYNKLICIVSGVEKGN